MNLYGMKSIKDKSIHWVIRNNGVSIVDYKHIIKALLLYITELHWGTVVVSWGNPFRMIGLVAMIAPDRMYWLPLSDRVLPWGAETPSSKSICP